MHLKGIFSVFSSILYVGDWGDSVIIPIFYIVLLLQTERDMRASSFHPLLLSANVKIITIIFTRP